MVGKDKVPLCIDCYLKLVHAITLVNNQLAQEANYLMAMADAIVGIPGVGPRYEIPQPIVYQGQCFTRNINVNTGSVGIVNTGNIGRIDAAIDCLTVTQQQELVESFKTFTEAVLNESFLDAKAKDEVIEYLSCLASQLVLPKEGRAKAVCKIVFDSIGKVIGVASNLAACVNNCVLEG